jgi:hypothetical protein
MLFLPVAWTPHTPPVLLLSTASQIEIRAIYSHKEQEGRLASPVFYTGLNICRSACPRRRGALLDRNFCSKAFSAT